MKKYVFKIRILENSWELKKDDIIYVQETCTTKYHAKIKFTNKHQGSEYPDYDILEIIDMSYWFPFSK